MFFFMIRNWYYFLITHMRGQEKQKNKWGEKQNDWFQIEHGTQNNTSY